MRRMESLVVLFCLMLLIAPFAAHAGAAATPLDVGSDASARSPVCAGPVVDSVPPVNCCESLICAVCCKEDESPVCGIFHCYCRRIEDPAPKDPIIIPVVV